MVIEDRHIPLVAVDCNRTCIFLEDRPAVRLQAREMAASETIGNLPIRLVAPSRPVRKDHARLAALIILHADQSSKPGGLRIERHTEVALASAEQDVSLHLHITRFRRIGRRLQSIALCFRIDIDLRLSRHPHSVATARGDQAAAADEHLTAMIFYLQNVALLRNVHQPLDPELRFLVRSIDQNGGLFLASRRVADLDGMTRLVVVIDGKFRPGACAEQIDTTLRPFISLDLDIHPTGILDFHAVANDADTSSLIAAAVRFCMETEPMSLHVNPAVLMQTL